MTETAALIFLVLVIFIGSWTNIMISDLSSQTYSYSQAQTDLYSAMNWFKSNSSAQGSILSVTDWRITFLPLIAGRDGRLLMLADATKAVSYAEQNGVVYLLVTVLIPADIPQGFDLEAFYASFSSNQNLKLVYQNSNVLIYELVR